MPYAHHLLLLSLATATGDWRVITFDTPTQEPALNRAKQKIIGGGMPIGNGETTAIVFPVTRAFSTSPGFELREGVHMWLGMTTAMASDMTPFSLGIVSIVTDPPLGIDGFQQSLYLTNATVEVSTSVGSVSVWVDASTNAAHARVSGPWRSVNVSVQSVRPVTRFQYSSRCSSPSSAADVWSSPAGAASIGLSHRNMNQDVALLNPPAAFNATLRQQGLGALVDTLQSSDKWRGRQFGLVMSGTDLAADRACARCLVSERAASTYEVTITTHAEQTDSSAAWETKVGERHRANAASSDGHDDWRRAHDDWWTSFWARSHIWVSGNDTGLVALTERYAQARYVQAIQAGTWVPIKFNGMVFTSQLPPEAESSGPSFRQWGSCNWWQNTRLAYWNMHHAGDFEQMETIFQYYHQMLPFLQARTAAAFNHTGIYATETKTLFGAYDPCDYGTEADKRSAGDPSFGYEMTRWLIYDFGGDAGLPELCTMLLDYYGHTLDDEKMGRYMPLLAGTLDFFARHYGDVSKPGAQLTIFPTQALETYQCPTWPATKANCPTNDHPTVAALHVLTERALELPLHLTTTEQRAQWAALRAALPDVPMIVEEGVTVPSPYESYPTPGTMHVSNVETPELYSTHPFRYFTLGRSRLSGGKKRDIAPSIFCLEKSSRKTCRYADSNSGWTQGLMNAALLGRASKASAMTLARAQTAPASGYRFPAFMPHMQDYAPSEDHLANMNTALQLMLLAPADNGLDAGGALLFPAWPCAWDVDFKLFAPRNTVVTGQLIGGQLVNLTVTPPERTSAIEVLPCQ